MPSWKKLDRRPVSGVPCIVSPPQKRKTDRQNVDRSSFREEWFLLASLSLGLFHTRQARFSFLGGISVGVVFDYLLKGSARSFHVA